MLPKQYILKKGFKTYYRSGRNTMSPKKATVFTKADYNFMHEVALGEPGKWQILPYRALYTNDLMNK